MHSLACQYDMTTRRDFLKDMLAGITVVGFVPGVLVSCSDSTGSDNNNNQTNTFVVSVALLDAEGKALRSELPDSAKTPIMVVRRASNTYVTLELICTHQGCKGPSLELSGQTITCGCHGSQYDLDGRVTRGPAPRDLDTYKTTYDSAKNEVTIEY